MDQLRDVSRERVGADRLDDTGIGARAALVARHRVARGSPEGIRDHRIEIRRDRLLGHMGRRELVSFLVRGHRVEYPSAEAARVDASVPRSLTEWRTEQLNFRRDRASAAAILDGMTITGEGSNETRFWHPFADMSVVKNSELVITRADDVWVWDDDGRRYLDGTASLWYANVGHGRP